MYMHKEAQQGQIYRYKGPPDPVCTFQKGYYKLYPV